MTGDIVKEYLKKWGNLPSLTLAKKIFAEVPNLKSVDQIRTCIRYYRGASGDGQRERLRVLDFVDHNPYNLPQSFSEEFFPYKIETKCLGVLSDIHIPYHDIPAVNCALEYLKKKGINDLLLNGDIIDMYQASVHEKDPRKRHVAEEIADCIDFLTMLKKNFKRVIYKLGNHEERYERYLMVKSPELLNIPDFEIQNVLKLDSLGIDYQTCDKQIMQVNSLNIVHGHEIGKSFIPAVNPARGLFLRAKTSSMCGHFHRSSEHTERDINGKITKCWSTGCLCDLSPRWLPINNWGHGAAIVHTDGEDFHVENFTIINGRKL